ncbi:RxLR effector protein [Phytophthora megakarya]|uniref:RxLR effector protein n=1 Tax=Phytophthora megakarya TaxID=4795 RepID=A0A225WAI7_9STRA|nr:RxLR effector protein [Phytophthora megakarya]
MQFHHLILLAATIVFSSVDAAPGSKTARLRISTETFIVNQRTERHLRTNNDAGEERGINLKSLPGIKTFSGLFKSKITPDTLTAWSSFSFEGEVHCSHLVSNDLANVRSICCLYINRQLAGYGMSSCQRMRSA